MRVGGVDHALYYSYTGLLSKQRDTCLLTPLLPLSRSSLWSPLCATHLPHKECKNRRANCIVNYISSRLNLTSSPVTSLVLAIHPSSLSIPSFFALSSVGANNNHCQVSISISQSLHLSFIQSLFIALGTITAGTSTLTDLFIVVWPNTYPLAPVNRVETT